MSKSHYTPGLPRGEEHPDDLAKRAAREEKEWGEAQARLRRRNQRQYLIDRLNELGIDPDDLRDLMAE